MKKVIVFDVMGVVFKVGDDTNDLLVPYIHKLNPSISREIINEVYIEASLGRISSKEFWNKLGFVKGYEAIEKDYLDKCLEIDENFISVAESLGENYELAFLSNDVGEWAKYLRYKYNLDRLLKASVISGDVGCRKPDVKIYDILLERLKAKPQECIFIDDRYKNLKVASEIGFGTIRFNRELMNKTFEPDGEISSFTELNECLEKL